MSEEASFRPPVPGSFFATLKNPPAIDESQICRLTFDDSHSWGLRSEAFSYALQVSDYTCFLKKGLMNDNVLDAYMTLTATCSPKYIGGKVYAMKCFEYPIIATDGADVVARWNFNIDLLGHRLIIIPIHKAEHWRMAFVDVENRVVVVTDSLNMSKKDIEANLLEFLLAVARLSNKEAEFSTWTFCDLDVPQQSNNYDCGIFACQFARYISRGYFPTFTQANICYFRGRMGVEVFSKHLFKDQFGNSTTQPPLRATLHVQNKIQKKPKNVKFAISRP